MGTKIQQYLKAQKAEWKISGYKTLMPVYKTVKLNKYWKIIKTYSGQTSVHCFVDANGNIYKAASWKVPAKGIRGHIDNDEKPLLAHSYYK